MDAFTITLKVFLLTLWLFDPVESQISCTGPGLFPLGDINCQYYYQCSFNGIGYVPQIYKCPDGTVFDTNRKLCVLPTQYGCPATITTVNPYQCLAAGRYPIADPTCQQYYLCYWGTNGYVKRIYKCPNQTVFDPNRQLCVLRTAYVCDGNPGIPITTTSTTTTIDPNCPACSWIQ